MRREIFKDSPIGTLVRITGTDGRNQRDFDHIAYVPDPLQDQPPLTGDTWVAVGAANRALAGLDGAALLISNPDLLRRPTLSREAQSTSELEGTFAPIDDVLAAELDDHDEDSVEVREVVNYMVAARHAYGQIASLEQITLSMLCNAHRTLVRGTPSETRDAGKVRSHPVAIGSPSGNIEDARFVPMPPGDDLRSALLNLTDWITARTGSDIDPVVAAAMAHYQFETVHPFNDGNGRIGRLMIVLQFLYANVLSEPLLSVSPWFEARRLEYQDKLAKVSATGQWDDWVQFFAQGIAESADDTKQRVVRLMEVQKLYVDHLSRRGMKGVVRDICDVLVEVPIVSAAFLASRLGRTPPAIYTAIRKLVDEGILVPSRNTYDRRYLALDVRDVITAPIGHVPGRGEPLRRDRHHKSPNNTQERARGPEPRSDETI